MPDTVELDDDLIVALRARAEREGRPVAAVLADVVRRGLAAARSPEGAADEGVAPGWTTFARRRRLGELPVTHAFVRRMQEELDREDDARAMGLLREEPAELSEEDVRRLEEDIPRLAAPAFAEAYRAALAAGSAVLVREDDALVEVSPDGTRRVIRALLPPVPVPPRPPRPPADVA